MEGKGRGGKGRGGKGREGKRQHTHKHARRKNKQERVSTSIASLVGTANTA